MKLLIHFFEQPCQYQVSSYSFPSSVVNRNQLQAVFLDIDLCVNIVGFFPSLSDY